MKKNHPVENHWDIYLKGKKKATRTFFISIAWCRYCKKYLPIQIDTMIHKKKKIELHIAHCPFCKYVLNLDDPIHIRYVSEKLLATKGWKPAPPGKGE